VIPPLCLAAPATKENAAKREAPTAY